MNRYLLVPAILAVALTAGCVAPAPAVAAPPAAQAGEQVKMAGRLALKGSMPMVQVVLTRDNGERWELTNIPPTTAGMLQNKRVTVEGKVVRATATPMMLPSLAVTHITLAQ